MKKVEKIPVLSTNPQGAWEQIQTLRSKINELVDVVNGVETVSGKSNDERLAELQAALEVAVKAADMDKANDIIKEIQEIGK